MTMRALYSAIAGIQSNDQWLNVIGNNIANVNTVAYKASRVEFGDQLSDNLTQGAGDNPGSSLGGVDPQQVGLGTRVLSIETLFTQGSTIETGNPLDLDIQGDGFFMSRVGDQTFLTRAGNLNFDSHGFLVDANGGLVQGFTASLRYIQKTINTFSATPGQPLAITSGNLVLDNTNVSNIGNIRIPAGLTLPPKATSEIDFKGNLDSFQQANQPGGVLDLFPGGAQIVLPVAINNLVFPPGIAMDPSRLIIQPTATGGFTLKQVSNLSATVAFPIMNGGIDLGTVVANAGGYAWEQQPPVPPARSIAETVYDSLGNPRQVTVLFYQVNDLGTAQPPVNPPPGPSQACYAWYAFDTTGGKQAATSNLVGGTGIIEGDMQPPFGQFYYDRGLNGDLFMGDFLWFNTDGSLASSGGSGGPVPTPPGVPNFMSIPRVYLPPINQNPGISPIPSTGAEITAIDLNFGTFGVLGTGRRDGLFSDAEGSYQVVNGVSTYIPNHTAYASSQNGYPDGVLQNVQVDQTGVIKGSFTNGQIADLAQVVISKVDNPDGLIKSGGNYYRTGVNSGSTQTGLPGQQGFGVIQSSALEGSNVDLTVELSNMIIAQRSFDANAKTVADVNSSLNVLDELGRGG